MKKTIVSVLCIIALIASCKKESKSPEEETPTPTPTPVIPSNPSATSNNGIAIACMQFGNSPSNGKMIKIDIETKTATDLPLPMTMDDYFDVSPDGKTMVYMLQYVDTLIYKYNIADGSKTPLFLKTAEIGFPAGIHFNSDGSKILFLYKSKIYSINTNGNVTQNASLVSTLDNEAVGPYTWASDGKKLIANAFGGNTNTSTKNIAYIDVASGAVTRVSNGILKSGNNNEITQAQSEKEPNAAGAVVIQNGYWGNQTYGYRGWTTNANIYYYSNKDVYQLSGQSPAGVNTAVLFNLTTPTKTENSPAYSGMRVVQVSSDGKKYAAITAASNGKMKIFNGSDNSEFADLSSFENAAQRFAGIRFANK